MEAGSSQTEVPADEDVATLTISPEKVCFIIMKAREFDAKDEVSEPDPGSNPSDDKDAAVLEDHSDDPVVEELTSLINSLSEDEQIGSRCAHLAGAGRLSCQRLAHGARGGGPCAQRTYGRLSSRHAAARRLPRGGPLTSRPFLRRVRDWPPLIGELDLIFLNSAWAGESMLWQVKEGVKS